MGTRSLKGMKVLTKGIFLDIQINHRISCWQAFAAVFPSNYGLIWGDFTLCSRVLLWHFRMCFFCLQNDRWMLKCVTGGRNVLVILKSLWEFWPVRCTELSTVISSVFPLSPSVAQIGQNTLQFSHITTTFHPSNYLIIHLNQIQLTWRWGQYLASEHQTKPFLQHLKCQKTFFV